MRHIEEHALTQANLAKLLKAHHPDVSNLMMGKISKFIITKLIQFAVRLDLSAKIKVRPAVVGSGSESVGKRTLARETKGIS